MDLTPRLLTEVEFREQWRGYSKEDVDDFLERVALGLGELQQRLRELADRASEAERKAGERADDDEIRRTLVLAQRTAASAVEEARAEASELVTAAEARRAELEAEMAERRAVLQAELDALAELAQRHREALRAELTRQLDALEEAGSAEEPAGPAPGPPRATPSPSVAAPPARRADEVPPPASAAPQSPPPAPGQTAPADQGDYDAAQARADLVEALRLAGLEDVLGGQTEDPGACAAPTDDAPPRREHDDAGEPTRFFDALADDEEAAPAGTRGDDDPFLAELRRAVTDTEPLGPRDHEAPAAVDEPDDHPDDGSPSGRFRLRRGR